MSCMIQKYSLYVIFDVQKDKRGMQNFRRMFFFFNMSETGVLTVRHTRRQGKKQVSAVTSVLRGKDVTVWERT